MRTILCLTVIYFTGAHFLRWMTAIGLALLLTGSACLIYLPPLQAGAGLPSSLSLAQESLILSLPLFGTLGLFLGSALMPVMFVAFARSRRIYLLPFGRLKVLASVLITSVLIPLLAGCAALTAYVRLPIELQVVFFRTVTITFITFSVMYIILWWVSKARSSMGVLGGAMLALATLSLPVRFLANPSISLWGPLLACGALWVILTVAFLFAPRMKNIISALRQVIAGRTKRAWVTSRHLPGSEIDLLTGITRPWTLALGQIFPIAIASYFISQPTIWLFYFTLFSAISGAVTSFAAVRSRSLWLRMPWNRTELFAAMETAFWRHNSYALGVLMLLFVVLGIQMAFEPVMLAFGLALLVLGTSVSTYLGLMMTKGIGWLESGLAIFTMLLLMKAGLDATKQPIDTVSVVAIEIALAVLALAFRHGAMRRWSSIDWSLCRHERGSRIEFGA